MPIKLTYLLIDLGSLLVPFLFSFHPRIRFAAQWRYFFTANLLVALIFIVWDIFFTAQGVWGFNEKYILGVKIMGLPVEEVLFFFCIPYSSVFTYYCFKQFYPRISFAGTKVFTLVFAGLLFASGLLFWGRAYTSTTMILLGSILLLIQLTSRPTWLGHFFLMYMVILIPFFLVNGLLTGTGLQEPVVWYNNAENLGIRMLTIPIEDVFYGMLLLLLNTYLFERFKTAHVAQANSRISL